MSLDTPKPAAASVIGRNQRLTPSVAERLAELERLGAHLVPVWIRCPVNGPEHFSGLTRSMLYKLATEGKIRSVSIRSPGQARGCRLFHLASIFEFLDRCEVKTNISYLHGLNDGGEQMREQNAEAPDGKEGA